MEELTRGGSQNQINPKLNDMFRLADLIFTIVI